jgi:hypothetical protein
MKVPEGIENCKNKVYKLKKSLYGLKQAPAYGIRIAILQQKQMLEVNITFS